MRKFIIALSIKITDIAGFKHFGTPHPKHFVDFPYSYQKPNIDQSYMGVEFLLRSLPCILYV